jgi:hypothetical protein
MTPSELMNEAELFTHVNRVECAKELLEWIETGILKNGKVRELGRMVQFTGSSWLALAQQMVEREALKYIVENNKE